MFDPITGLVTYSTIILKGDIGRRYDEKRASVAITPGMAIEMDSDGKWKPHAVRGGKWMRAVAIEDALQGKDLVNTKGNTIDDDYAIGDLVRGSYLDVGDIWNALLHASENVAIGDWAISYGDGTVAKAATSFLANNLTDSATLTSWTTEVAFSTGTVTIPANTLKAGDILRIRGTVNIPSSNSTDTVLIKVKIGTTVLLATAALNITDADLCTFDTTVIIRTAGASGTLVANSIYSYGVIGTATTLAYTLGSTAVDTTAAQTLTVTATASVSSASNQAILRTLTVEQVKAGSSVANGSSGGSILGMFQKAVDNSVGVTSVRVPVMAI